MNDLKKDIRKNFNGAVHYYHEHANLQNNIADRLAKALEPWQYSVPDGPILEIGAGTGFFTRHLKKMFNNRELIVTDLSEEMLELCREHISDTDKVSFQTLDAEKADFEESTYALITGNYVLQWFKYPAKTLSRIASSLKPGGIILISFPASESFSNWRQYCLDLGIPYTGNTLPDLEKVVIELSMGPFQVDYYEDDMIETFSSVFDFFRHLKNLGTSTSLNSRSLSIKQLNLLNDYWLEQEKGRVKVQYHTAFIAAKRDLES